jgi:hypothetical protein
MDLNKKSYLLVFLLFFVVIVQYPSCRGSPAQCLYGRCDAWISFDGIKWVNTTIDYIELNRGEPFYIKTNITTDQKDVLVTMYFYEVGVYASHHASFEIISGSVEGIINHSPYMVQEFGLVKRPSSFEQIWRVKVRENATWWSGITPLNIHVSFNQQNPDDWYNWVGDEISFTMINVFINKSLFHSPSHLDEHTGNATESVSYHSFFGYHLHLFFLSILITIVYVRKAKDS